MAVLEEGGHADSATLLHTGSGALRGVLISHTHTAVETTTLYDNTAGSGTILMRLNVAPEQCPFFAWWPESHKIPFSTGLYVDPGSNTNVHLWWVGH